MELSGEPSEHREGLPFLNPWLSTSGSRCVSLGEPGIAISSFTHYPFGQTAESENGYEIRQQFTGQERDVQVGLDYMVGRYYWKAVARFIQPDSEAVTDLENVQSWNLYAYVSNSPVSAIDPDGAEDLRTDDEVRAMSDHNVLPSFGEAWVESSKTAYEWGFQVLNDSGNYSTTPPHTDGSYRTVSVGDSPDTEFRVHTHQYFVFFAPGSTKRFQSIPGEPGPDDGPNAQSTGKTTLIMTPLGLIRVNGPSDWRKVLTGKDWRRYLKAARAAYKAKKKVSQGGSGTKKKKNHGTEDKKDKASPPDLTGMFSESPNRDAMFQ